MAADERTTREMKRAAVLAHEYGVDFRIADRIARAELEREGKLVDALRPFDKFRAMVSCGDSLTFRTEVVMDAANALAVYEAEFAPPKRTLAQVAADVVRGYSYRDDSGDEFCAVRKKFVDELAEALKRAEGGA